MTVVMICLRINLNSSADNKAPKEILSVSFWS